MPLSEEDEQAIDQALQAWRQGDVSLDAGLEVFHLADLTRPHSPASAQFAASLAAAGEAIDAGAEPVRVEVRGVVMLSQTCDVVRGWRCRRTPRRSAPATCRRHVHRACGERRIPGKREDGRVRRRQRGVRVPSRPGRAQPHSSGRYLPFRFGFSSGLTPSAKREGNVAGALFGETIVFTGALVIPRQEVADRAAEAGCGVANNVGKKVTMLVVGTQAGASSRDATRAASTGKRKR